MTTAATKTKIQPTWDTNKIREEAVNSMTGHMGLTFKVLGELGPEAQKKFHNAMIEYKVAHYKKLNVKTPIEMVRAMAEFEVNVFGSKINIWGDEKEAHMEYEYCACWNAMQKNCSGAMSEKEQECMSTSFNDKMAQIAKAFGWSKGEVKFPTKPNEPAVVHFVK
jgi:hypothetical protein